MLVGMSEMLKALLLGAPTTGTSAFVPIFVTFMVEVLSLLSSVVPKSMSDGATLASYAGISP